VKRITAAAESVLAQLEQRGDDGVWISTVRPDDLLRRAAELDEAGPLPLRGLPFAVKDNIDVAGMPTTAACPDFAYLPERTAPVVRRLLAAGALLVGKTNLDQFATGLTGARSPYGTPESVFGGGLISGGSSSGSAVAVAAGLVAFSLGTDTAGSGRVPAAFNGIVGIKPTRGLLSTLGVVPACRSLDCVSIFAPDVAGAAAVLRVARGLEPDDPWGRAGQGPVRVAPRVGVPRALEFFGDAGQEKAFAAGAGRLGETVAVDIEPFFEAGDLLYRGPWVAERLAEVGDFLPAMLPTTRAVIEAGGSFSAVDLWRAQHRLRELRYQADRLWEQIDVLVVPTVGTTYTHAEIAADPIGRNLNLGRYTQFANLLDLAAVTVPNGFTADGRPASLTLLGPAFSDETLALLAASLAPVDLITLAVVGLHLQGEPRNGELIERGGTLVGAARTAPCYRLYRLPSGVPGLVRGAGRQIDVELWQLPAAEVGGLLAGVRAPLGFGRVLLDDGREVTGFLCEAYAAAGAEDITDSGGWRAYRNSIGRQ
jgi:allophanate hydrolase